MAEDEKTSLREDSLNWAKAWTAAYEKMTEGRLPSKRAFVRGISRKLDGQRLSPEEFLDKVEEEKGEEKAEEVKAVFDRFESNKRNPTKGEIFSAIDYEDRQKWRKNWKASFGVGFEE